MKLLPALLIALLLPLVTGCVMGGTSVIRTADYQNLIYDKAFAAAIRAMNDIGKVTNSDKDAGYVNGTSDSGLDLGVTIEKAGSSSVKLNVKGTPPAGMFWIGRLTEVDDFLATYKQYAQ